MFLTDVLRIVTTLPRLHTFLFFIAVVLWSDCLPVWVTYLSGGTIKPETWLNCKLVYFVLLFSLNCSSCLLTVMCIEKFFALYFPLKTRSICTVAMAKKVTFVLVFILVAFNLQHFFIWEADVLPNGYKYCKLVNVPPNYIKIYIKMYYTLYSFAPLTIMVLANGAIIYKFMQASCARDQGGTESTNQALSKSANRGTAMLITVAITFLLLTGPVAVFDNDVNLQINPITSAIIFILRYTNHSINAVLYCISGSRFRNELLKTFPFRVCRKKTTNPRSGSQSVSSLSGNSTRGTITSGVSVTASPN